MNFVKKSESKTIQVDMITHACTSQKVPPLSAQIRMDLSGILETCDDMASK